MCNQHPSSDEMTLKDLVAQSYLKIGQEAFVTPIETIIDAVYKACRDWKDPREIDDGK